MPSHITIAQAFEQWNADIKRYVIAAHGADDYPALAESWNDYTDGLNKDGQLNALQYQYCPAWDDEMPDDDGAFLLERMGVEMHATSIVKRSDGAEWHAGASHWSCFIRRVGTGAKRKEGFAVEYSMGSAHRDSPKLADVFGCLLSDADSTEETFEDWCDSLGYDSDSRKAERTYHACRATAAKVAELFSKSELDDLREVFADR
ncbi:hypothetical protein [Burkholderia cepacia]|uniref:hypothetical protein n=1 Tax=Burkholderia cepacia TaxID=292 RepID=UPI00075A6C03|nr:hypothetical protein [Burkholderia cepacia]KWH50715.1 hypothetical protein WM00_20645 [Burkholderia cepacia]